MNLPSDFVSRSRMLFGEDDYLQFCRALKSDPPVSVRTNPLKRAAKVAGARPVPWCSTGFYLSDRPTFTFDPLFHAGTYYVQEASSMFLEQVLRQYVTRPVVMLDLCAAPGGKSTLARTVLPSGSVLVSNEVMRARAQVLAENCIKWGHPQVVVTQNSPEDFSGMEHLFDVVLADVPCSGEGMFRKDSAAIEEWSLDNVCLCQYRQQQILQAVWNSLKPGGLLIYSTCTYNCEENEQNVAWIASQLGADILEVAVGDDWNITGNLSGDCFPVYRFLPHRTRGEGLFMAVLRKHGRADEGFVPEQTEAGAAKKSGNRKNGAGRRQAFPQEVREWLIDPDEYVWESEHNLIRAIPRSCAGIYAACGRHLHVLHAGVTVATVKGNDCIPHPSLALSAVCNRERFVTADVDYARAISYLRKEAVTLGADIPKGYVLLTYQGVALGFVKHLGSRANNLYPAEWRIRSGYVPESVVCVD